MTATATYLIDDVPTQLARRHFDAMERGDENLAQSVLHPEHLNHEASTHPPASAQLGLPGFMATSAWPGSAFSDRRVPADRSPVRRPAVPHLSR